MPGYDFSHTLVIQFTHSELFSYALMIYRLLALISFLTFLGVSFDMRSHVCRNTHELSVTVIVTEYTLAYKVNGKREEFVTLVGFIFPDTFKYAEERLLFQILEILDV